MNPGTQQNLRNVVRYIPRLGGSLVFAGGAVFAFLNIWEPDKQDPGLVYADKLAGDLPTVCNGITKHVTSLPVVVGERWAPEKCAREEAAALTRLQERLVQCFTRLPPQAVFDMATSHAWNNGVANTCTSLAMVAWNEGKWDLGCRRISHSDSGKYVWSYVKTGRKLPDGKPEYRFVQGLANRRDAETKNCLTYNQAHLGYTYAIAAY